MKRISFVGVVMLFSVALVAAERNPKVDPIFAEYDKPDSPGCSVGVLKDGAFLYKRGYGMANLDYGIPNTSQTLFDIASTSKQFAAMAILLLEQQGKLSLDDPVQKHLPEIPKYSAAITIRHLLSHTSGMRDYLTLASLSGLGDDDFYSDEDVVRMVARQKALNFNPGDEFLYSNTGFFLLSQIVKRATGQTLREFAQTHMLNPVGMSASHYHDDHTEIDRHRATGYSPRESGPDAKKQRGFRINMSTLDMVGDGGIYTSVDDLAKWDENFYTGKVGGRELLAKMQTPDALNNGEKLEYGLGLFVGSHRGLKIVSHGGSWAGFRSELLRFPEQHFSVICLCNISSADPSRLARRVADVFLAGQLQPEKRASAVAIKVPASELEQKAGWYRSASTGRVLNLELRKDRLTAQPFGLEVALEPLSPAEFRSTDAPVEMRLKFEPPVRMLWLRENQKPEVFEKITLVKPSPEALREYAGEYYSSELDVRYRFEVEDGKLRLRMRNAPREPLMPTIQDEFQVASVTFNFVRDAGRIVGFDLGAGRVTNLRFDRVPATEAAAAR